jgi:hypothetical protein
MEKKNGVTLLDMCDKIQKSYGFFILINEGKKISVIVDTPRSLDMIADYLCSHPEICQQVIDRINEYKANLN